MCASRLAIPGSVHSMCVSFSWNVQGGPPDVLMLLMSAINLCSQQKWPNRRQPETMRSQAELHLLFSWHSGRLKVMLKSGLLARIGSKANPCKQGCDKRKVREHYWRNSCASLLVLVRGSIVLKLAVQVLHLQAAFKVARAKPLPGTNKHHTPAKSQRTSRNVL